MCNSDAKVHRGAGVVKRRDPEAEGVADGPSGLRGLRREPLEAKEDEVEKQLRGEG